MGMIISLNIGRLSVSAALTSSGMASITYCGTLGSCWRMIWAKCVVITSTSCLPMASALVTSRSCSITARFSAETSSATAAPIVRTAKHIEISASFALFMSLSLGLEQRGVSIVASRVDLRLGKHELRAAQRRRLVLARQYVMQLRHERLRVRKEVFVEEPRGLRMRRLARDADAVDARDERLERKPVDRRALSLGVLDHVAVERERQRHLAGYHHVGEHRVAVAHREPARRGDAPEKLGALPLAERPEHRAIPLACVRLSAEPAFPTRIRQIGPAPRQLIRADRRGVIGLHEDIDELRRPAAVLRQRALQQRAMRR